MYRRPFKTVMLELAQVHPHLLKRDGTLNANAIAKDCGNFPSQPTITRLLNNDKQIPGSTTAGALGARYNVPEAYIRGEIEHPRGTVEIDLPYPLVLMVKRLLALPVEARQQLVRFIETLEELQDRKDPKQNVIPLDPLAGRKKHKPRSR